MCKGLWCFGFIFFLCSCGLQSTTRGENKYLLEGIFSTDLLHDIYSQCYQTPFKSHLYFEGAFRFEIFLSKNQIERRFHITRPFHQSIDSCAQKLIADKLQHFVYQGPDLLLEDAFYFIWPENLSDS